jgi:hypothetical protein
MTSLFDDERKHLLKKGLIPVDKLTLQDKKYIAEKLQRDTVSEVYKPICEARDESNSIPENMRFSEAVRSVTEEREQKIKDRRENIRRKAEGLPSLEEEAEKKRQEAEAQAKKDEGYKNPNSPENYDYASDLEEEKARQREAIKAEVRAEIEAEQAGQQ